jgi:hypothetical protein
MYEQEVEYEISTLSQQIEPILITARSGTSDAWGSSRPWR